MEIQATQQMLGTDDGSPWKRIPIKGPGHTALRLTFWLMATKLRGKFGGGVGVFAIALRVILWLPTSVLIWLAKTGPDKSDEESSYCEFKHRYTGTLSGSTMSSQHLEPIHTGRLLRPRYLCLADEEHEHQIVSVLEWERTHGPNASLEYVFIAYTTEQFWTEDDYDELHAIAARAARAAGVPAYWIACSCMPEDDMNRAILDQVVDLAADIYRISDVVRGSHSLVIVVGSPGNATPASTESLLKEWGRRMWTFPEVVLSPSHKDITIYTRGGDLEHPLRVRKALFPRLAWTDANDSQQLIDHYEGIQSLGYLQLVSTGLKCLAARETQEMFKGDMVYALMGLLWCRPEVRENDTAFQAFCRLSLANDSNHLLERLICLCPSRPEQKWHDIDDYWNRKLWQIDPSCRVAAVAGNDSVIITGGLGCAIHWTSFPRVALGSASTLLAGLCLYVAMFFLIPAGFICAASGPDKEELCRAFSSVQISFFGVFLLACLYLPFQLHSLTKTVKAAATSASSGPRKTSQPWLIGFEGDLDLETLETRLFGYNTGHLRWSVDCSSLSRSRSGPGSEGSEPIGLDPRASDPDLAEILDEAADAPFGHQKIFTLVDTYNMTVTLFLAVHPPVAMVLCGSEGGMQRALLCSYDQEAGCLYREAVLRVPGTMAEKMHPIDQFRLGLKRGG
ncbi:hypothetical protein BJY00DRAFT_47457 [Aspergillus carlsbadensis]|nr:hypothetical protein BJY00DRAFT_47457 [Aspergillus carlsbadensis]